MDALIYLNRSKSVGVIKSSFLNQDGSWNKYLGKEEATVGWTYKIQHIDLLGIVGSAKASYVLYCILPAKSVIGASEMYIYNVEQ